MIKFLAVVNIKDIIKFIKNCIIIIFVIFIIIKVINIFKNVKWSEIFEFNNFFATGKSIDDTILLSNYFKNNYSEKKSGIKKILVSELAIWEDEEKLMEKENQEEIVDFESDDKNNENIIESNETEKIEENTILDTNTNTNNSDIPQTLNTSVISQNNKKDTYTDIYQSVKIKNESKYQLTPEMVTPNVDFLNKKDIIIYHTHTCESYTPTEANNYQASGNFRTTDLNYSVARVGSELTSYLNNFGFNVIHNTTYHDYPAYTGSYTKSLATINEIINKMPNAQLVIDLHRDALGSSSTYGPTVQIGDEIAAQVMFVIGTDGGGLKHPNWLNNFKLAIKIQEKANQMYPGLFKPIILRNSRYNQHVTTGACIIEVGATGNTLEQCNTSMKYLSKVIAEVMK